MPSRSSQAGPLANPVLRGARDFLDTFVDMVEAGLTSGPRRRQPLVTEDENGSLVLRSRGGNAVQTLDTADESSSGPPKEIELQLAPTHIVAARLNLPKETRAYLDRIVEHRLERLIPWKVERALYAYAVRDGTASEIDVEVVATSRDRTQQLVDRLARQGYRAAIVTAAGERGPIAFDIAGQAGRRGARRQIIRGAILALLVTSMAGYAGSAWYAASKRSELVAVEATMARTRQALVAREGDAVGGAVRVLLDEKTPERAVFVLLDQIADAVPDHTFLDQIDVTGQNFRLVGSSSDASALLSSLQERFDSRAIRFDSPVSRLADGRDRVEIAAQAGEAAP